MDTKIRILNPMSGQSSYMAVNAGAFPLPQRRKLEAREIWFLSRLMRIYRVTQKKLHELDRLCLLDSKRYEDKQGVAI